MNHRYINMKYTVKYHEILLKFKKSSSVPFDHHYLTVYRLQGASDFRQGEIIPYQYLSPSPVFLI